MPCPALKATPQGADRPGMESFLNTLGYGFLALLGAAILVAVLEHLRNTQRARLAPPPPLVPRAAHVDIDLMALDAGTAGDVAKRQAAVDTALAQMVRPGRLAAESQSAWIETRPMVGMTAETESR